MPELRNLLSPISAPLPQERLETLAEGAGRFRLERIVSRQHASPPGFWYDQDTIEWVVLLSGSALLELLDADGCSRRCRLAPGDFLEIPAHCRHRVEETDAAADTIWLALHVLADAAPPGDAGR